MPTTDIATILAEWTPASPFSSPFAQVLSQRGTAPRNEWVRSFANVLSVREPPREPVSPDLVRPEAFIEWGVPSTFADDFREAAKRVGETSPANDSPLQGTLYEEAHTWEDFQVTNPEDSSQSVIVRRRTAIAFRSPHKDPETLKHDQVKFTFQNSGENLPPTYKNKTAGQPFTPVVLSPFEQIVDVGWGGPFLLVIIGHYPETQMTGGGATGSEQTLLGIGAGDTIINPINVERGEQHPPDLPDPELSYKGLFSLTAKMQQPNPDPPDDTQFDEDGDYASGKEGHLKQACSTEGQQFGDESYAPQAYGGNGFVIVDSPVGTSSSAIANLPELAPTLDDKGKTIKEWRQDFSPGSIVEMCDGSFKHTVNGEVHYPRISGFHYIFKWANLEVQPYCDGFGFGSEEIFNGDDPRFVPPASDAIACYSNIQQVVDEASFKLTVFREWTKSDVVPDEGCDAQVVGFFVNLVEPLKAVSGATSSYALDLRYGGVGKADGFESDGKRKCEFRAYRYPRSKLAPILEHMERVSSQVSESSSGDTPHKYQSLSELLEEFDPNKSGLKSTGAWDGGMINVTYPYGPHFSISVSFGAGGGITFLT